MERTTLRATVGLQAVQLIKASPEREVAVWENHSATYWRRASYDPPLGGNSLEALIKMTSGQRRHLERSWPRMSPKRRIDQLAVLADWRLAL